MDLRDQLLAIREERGRLTPAIVVDAARPESHPLHSRFEWDDKVAGEAYRRDQAHRLIRAVRVVYREADDKEAARTVRGFHAIRDETGHAYDPVEEIAENPLATKILLQDMQREWQQLVRRYGHFQEFIEMVKGDLGGEDKAA